MTKDLTFRLECLEAPEDIPREIELPVIDPLPSWLQPLKGSLVLVVSNEGQYQLFVRIPCFQEEYGIWLELNPTTGLVFEAASHEERKAIFEGAQVAGADEYILLYTIKIKE